MNEREREEYKEEGYKTGYGEYSEYSEDYMAGSTPYEQRYEDLSHKSSDELEDEIDRIRMDMDKTLSAIERRFSPGEIIDRSLRYFKGGPGEYMASLGTSIKEKPLPAALVGIGLGWLMLAESGRAPGTVRFSSAQRSGETREKMEEAKGKVSDAAHRAKEKLGGVSHAVSERMHRVGERMHQMGERAHGSKQAASEWGHRVSEVGHRSGERLHQAQSRVTNLVQEQPLILGVLGVAAGALLGAMLPHTRREDEVLGPAKERMKEQVAETGREQMAKAQAIAAAAAQSAREEADRQLH